MAKMKKIARVLDALCRVLFWMNLVFGVLLAALNAALLTFGPELLEVTGIRGEIILGHSVSIQTPSGVLNQMDEVVPWLLGSLGIFLAVGVSCWVLRVIRHILAPMKEGRPFDARISGRFRLLGWLSIGLGLASNLCALLLNRWAAWSLKELDLVSEELNLEFVLDGSFLVFALLLFLFSYIFRYGEELQKLSDETL